MATSAHHAGRKSGKRLAPYRTLPTHQETDETPNQNAPTSANAPSPRHEEAVDHEKASLMNTMPTTDELTDEECNFLEDLFAKRGARVKAWDAHWIHGADSGEDFCYKCCKKEVANLKKKDPKGEYIVDGGWRTDHDTPPFCYRCGRRLDGCLTDYGCEAELDHFLEHGVNLSRWGHCYEMSEVINGRGWKPWSERIYEHEYQRESDVEYFANLHTLGRRILDSMKRTRR